MAAVTQTVPNFLGGVSNQPDDKKLPGQVKEALNTYPDPTFGLQKRPGFKFLAELKETGGAAWDNNDLDNAKWFYYNRDADERYVGCIVGNATTADAAVHVWNAIPDGGGNYVKATVALTLIPLPLPPVTARLLYVPLFPELAALLSVMLYVVFV